MPDNLTCVDSIIDLHPADSDLGYKLRSNFKFLRTFLIYISELIDVDDDLHQHLGDTVAEIEAAFADSASAVGKASNEGKESLNALCRNLMEKLESFKPKIMQVYDYLSDHKVQCHSSIKFYIWQQCVVSIRENMNDLIRFKNLTASLKLHINALSEKLRSLELLIIGLGKDNCGKLIDFWTHAGSVALSAAKLSFFCWVEKEGIENDVMLKMVSDMRQKIDGSTPEVLEVYLSAVKYPPNLERHMKSYLANELVEFLLPRNVLVETYRQGLVYLVTFLIRTSQEHKEEGVELILADIKSVLMETTTIDYSTHKPQKNYPALLQFPEKIELLKAEVFLMDLLKSSNKAKTSSIIPFESLEKGLASLQTFRKRQQKQDQGKVKQLLTNFEMVVADVGSLWHLTQANGKAEEGEKDVLKLLLHIKLLKAEVYLMELLKDQTAFKDQSENLHQGLEILRKFLSRPPEEKATYGKPILTHIEEVGGKALSVYHSFHANQETEDRVMEMNVSLSKLLEEIKLVRAEIEGTFCQVRRSSPFSFPETNGPGFVDCCLENLKQLVNRDAFPIDYVNRQTGLVLKELESLRSFVNDASKHHETNDLRARIVNLAYEADYVIDSILLGNGSVCYHMAWLSDVIEELKFSNAQVKEVKTVAETTTPRPSTLSTPKIEEFILELEHQESTIRDRLIGGTEDREIVSIVGMGGIGKSTLAKKVYNDPNVRAEFPIRAWGCVSEVYDKRRLLLDIFNFVRQPAEQVEDKTYEAIAHLLQQRLSRKKFLIVLDDLWDTGAWNDLVASFPDNKNGSRILLTSREREVALNIIKVGGGPVPYELPPLDEDQSWNLLEEKVFHGKDCPWELVKYGRKIAEGCHGLPLAIVAVAGILKREEVDWWKEIANDVSIAAAANSWLMDILELSYKHLPDKLKPCFLYLGAFQGDKEILARKLLKLWIAEGFIRKDDPNVSAESIAELYLMDLIGRSLVIASEEKSQGGIKTCRVHSMLRQLCQSKAEKEHFLQPVTGYEEHFDSSYHDSDYGVYPNYAGPSNPIKYEQHRLSIYSKRNHFAMLKPSGPPVRSLLFFATNDKSPSCRYDISFISHNFKLLKVLDLESINVESSFPPGIVLLKRLRYLAVSGDIDSIPPSIANLWNLETFLVKGLKGTVIIPEAIWGMQNLKHFHVGNAAMFSFQPKNSSNLVSLSTPSLSCGEVAEKIAKKLPGLQKLRCIFSRSPGHSGNCKRSSVMSFLTRLESLNVSYYGGVPHSCEFGFPLTLKKLSLSNLHLSKSYISTIGRLPELKVLKLISVAFDKQRWEMEDEEFRELEYLKIDNSGIVQWIACKNHLRNLRGLVLRSCSQLETVPSSFSEINSLQMIELQWCGQAVIDSASEIEKEKRDANQPFKLSMKGL